MFVTPVTHKLQIFSVRDEFLKINKEATVGGGVTEQGKKQKRKGLRDTDNSVATAG